MSCLSRQIKEADPMHFGDCKYIPFSDKVLLQWMTVRVCESRLPCFQRKPASGFPVLLDLGSGRGRDSSLERHQDGEITRTPMMITKGINNHIRFLVKTGTHAEVFHQPSPGGEGL